MCAELVEGNREIVRDRLGCPAFDLMTLEHLDNLSVADQSDRR